LQRQLLLLLALAMVPLLFLSTGPQLLLLPQ
jgi:hypothetical protein